ncbi:ATP-binding protein [Anabaena sp. UHCC 0187]|uniref:NB-ARC domain-containing protein n=1 Tax=Anabaena sp. UHCC 0187 TaxID=2590018 RepID=UPI001448949A|nr:NB-ARC domain-containing protein [Anabaena sp. UHCC 0187]MTJ14968.1 ATP-binding protein [Anabaena sp. UHCC 0187]
MINPVTVMNDNKQSGTDKLEISRRKSAMVLFELEQALGYFVELLKPDPNELPSRTVEFFEKEGRIFDKTTTRGIVAATYLEEVLSMAKDAAKERTEKDYLERLQELFKVLEVRHIRNAISHPNKPFHHCYWHRVAAIATDPLIDKLQFSDVTQAFLDAEAGRLLSPPDTWINEPIWSLPNNLPQLQQFDHALTGLIGRQREISELIKTMRNKRYPLIALVAPGGLGKTALLLQALYDTVHSPESVDWVDQILYFSSKTELLTTDGVIAQIPSTATIDGICLSIASTLAEQESLDKLTFEDACNKFDKRRILLCLDNLETILRDDPNTFNSFYSNLPEEWRVIVTSRISLNSGNTIPLKPLDSNGAQKLAREYLLKRSGQRLSEDELKNIVQACDSIPLAIRLTIDGFIAGHPLNLGISKAKEQVLEFSYKNLLEALSPMAYEVLECLFVTDEPITRANACLLLQRNVDDIAEAFSQLQGTSLVTRIPEITEESYILSSSVRDLMLFSPIDPNVRSAVEAKLRNTRQILREIDKSPNIYRNNPISGKYIPDSATEQVRMIALDAFRELSRQPFDRRLLSDIFNTLKLAIEACKDQSILYRIRGLVLLKLNDRLGGKRSLQQAWDMGDIASGLILSNELRKDKDYKGAKDLGERLVELGWDNPDQSDVHHARMVIQNYYLPLIWLGETEKAIEATKDWQNAGPLRGTKGSLLAQALRQSAEYGPSRSVQKSLCEAIDVLNEVFDLEGHTGPEVAVGIKLVNDLWYGTGKISHLSEDAKLKFTTFVDKHLVKMCQVHNDYTLYHPDVQKWVKKLSNLQIESGNNPLTSARWKNLIETSKVDESEIDISPEEGWVHVSVYYRPTLDNRNQHKPFLFAKDKDNRQYYVRRDKLRSVDKNWPHIKIDDCLEVIPDPQYQEGVAQPVLDARVVKC